MMSERWLKGNLDNERGNPLLPLDGLLFLINSMGFFTCTISKTTDWNEKYLNGSTRNKGHVLFNDALGTFYLLLYGVGHMVKDH